MNKSKVRVFVVMCGMLLGGTAMLRADIPTTPGPPVIAVPVDDYACSGDSPSTDCCKNKYPKDRSSCLVCCAHTFDPGSQSSQNTTCNTACPKID